MAGKSTTTDADGTGDDPFGVSRRAKPAQAGFDRLLSVVAVFFQKKSDHGKCSIFLVALTSFGNHPKSKTGGLLAR